ncbi:hypothetical protein DFQ10_10218 [Winogradskyella eximia]|uniref:Uncharacterized protein n=1 Tax=Winogradskyella eximia TaxID=262006 RepID=A0A3D9H7M2_9FLAO|nr:hypothetical protein DFQ10_10218 [Winogradskyella eximia]
MIINLRRIFLFFVFVTFLNCNSKKNSESTESSNAKLQRIELLNLKMKIPNNYDKISSDYFSDILEKSIYRNKFTEFELKSMDRYRKFGSNAEIFVDNDDITNVIIFHGADYIKMSKEALELYIEMVDGNIFADAELKGIEYKRLEGEFLNYGLAEVVKVKFSQTYHQDESTKTYLTNYLVSHNLKSFGIIVINKENIDFQYVLDNFKL